MSPFYFVVNKSSIKNKLPGAFVFRLTLFKNIGHLFKKYKIVKLVPCKASENIQYQFYQKPTLMALIFFFNYHGKILMIEKWKLNWISSLLLELIFILLLLLFTNPYNVCLFVKFYLFYLASINVILFALWWIFISMSLLFVFFPCTNFHILNWK